MAISTDYPHPITVNGYSCRNCSDVALAKRHVDPADPASGPFGVNGTSPGKEATKTHFSPEARNQDMMREEHRKQQQGQDASGVAAAYGAAGAGTTPGRFVDLTA